MTKNNLDAIKEIEKFGFNWKDILSKIKYSEDTKEEDEEEKEVIDT